MAAQQEAPKVYTARVGSAWNQRTVEGPATGQTVSVESRGLGFLVGGMFPKVTGGGVELVEARGLSPEVATRRLNNELKRRGTGVLVSDTSHPKNQDRLFVIFNPKNPNR